MINPLTQAAFNSEPNTNGTINGVVVATVTNNQDPEGLARVRVHLPWLGEEEESYWAHIVTPMAMADHGMFFLPEIGDQVLVSFAQGDPTHPYVLGSLWNGNAKPPASNDDGKNEARFIRTRSGSELRFEDSDKPSITLMLKDGKQLQLNDDGIVLEDGQGNTLQIESSSGNVKITSNGSLELNSKQISLNAEASMELKASGTLTLKGQLVQIN